MKGSKCRCACYAGFVGIGLCTTLMVLSMAGVATVALSKNSNVGSIINDPSMSNHTLSVSQNIVLTFFDGMGGQVILVASFASMLTGMWFSGNRKLLPIAILGIVVLYVGMYQYYFVGFQIAGAMIMVITHLPVYSHKVARILKLA